MAETNNGFWNNQSGQLDDAHEDKADGVVAGNSVENDETQAEQDAGTNNAAGEQVQEQPQEAATESLDPLTFPSGHAQESQSAHDEHNDQDGVSATQETAPLYRPAPEYGAYGPTPTSTSANGEETGTQTQPMGSATQPLPVWTGAQGSQYGQGANAQYPQDHNPYAFPGADSSASDGRSTNGAGAAGAAGGAYGAYGAGASNDARNSGVNPFANPAAGSTNAANGNAGNGGGNGNGNGPQGPGMPPFGNGGMPPAGRPGVATQRRTASNVVVAVVAAVISAALCLGLGYAALTNGWVTVPGSGSLSRVSSNTSGSGTAKAESGQAVDWTTVSKNVSGSVVSIQTQLSNGTAKGSGAIVDTSGYVVTNNHVISGAQSIQVTLSNGQIYSASVVGTDTTTDLAVIKIDNPPSDLKAVEFADSDNLAVGEAVMAIGNPLGYDDTATTGIVSALNRPVSVVDDNNSEIVTNAVQIDAAINPGNSGGPTFNGAGQVIGINSSIASTSTSSDSSTSGSIGIGFAIPSNLVKRVVEEIMKDGLVKHVALGVRIQSTTVEADGVTRGGAQVVSVVSGSAAEKAGLKVNDTIVAFNGNSVTNNYALLGFVRAAALGDTAKLTVVRDGKTIEIDVTLDQEESDTSSSSSGNSQNDNQNNDNDSGNGFSDPFGLW
ncbi:MAG: trypsin-like peptidase domain-containing protein [Bifidobacterium tsurumiense]|uniref:S1C family serine protease n=1 Tax=Bifidobacterium tsurumiense TaxID=356829 RepID=UPI002A7F82EE|nr:trypsin-like peptidase domain-containing protein [Bifidobacterium tsurumiense]MDY4678480.1 trypsin-like peptidase domain-containing protein [Bifidobacterium tsurumiense]